MLPERLIKCEIRYCITRKELAALIFGLKHYRQYLLGRKFRVRSDHAALRYLRSATELIGQQGRWLATLEEFDFKLEHRAGLLHGNADSMSRKTPCEEAGGQCPQCSKWKPKGESESDIEDEDFTRENGTKHFSCFMTRTHEAQGETPPLGNVVAPPNCNAVCTRAESDQSGILKRKLVSTQLNPYAKEYKARVPTPRGRVDTGEGLGTLPLPTGGDRMSGGRNPGDRTLDNRIENNRSGNNRISDERITGDLSVNDLVSDNEMSSELIGGNVNLPVFTPHDTTPRGGGVGGESRTSHSATPTPMRGGGACSPCEGKGQAPES